jgi:hypothetical protein
MLLVQFAEDEGFPVPDKATRLDESVLGGARAAFIRLAVRPWGTVPAWFIAPGTAGPDRTRSLRLCLLRLHAEQEALDLILDQLRRGSIRYDPDTDIGSKITAYLNEATRRINKQSWGGVPQSAILAAIDAAESVRYIDDRSGVLDRLDGAQRQIRLKIEEYERRRRAERRVIVVQGGASYMERADNSVTITNSQVSRTNISPGARMEQVLMDFSGADVDQERKQAVADLHAEAKKLLEQLPDDKAKAQVEQRVEIITKQAEEDDPIEDIVRMAGQGLVEVGKKVEGMAEPISRVVNKVLDVLRFAPLVL